MTKFEELCYEIDAGPFSILSDAAWTRIKALIRLDGYERGCADGQKKAFPTYGLVTNRLT